MIYTLSGKVSLISHNFLVIEAHGIGFRVFCPHGFLVKLKEGDGLKIFTFLQVKENNWDLYGFEDKAQLSVFELLNLVNGVGPKSALAIMNTSSPKDILAAIKEGRADLLVQVAGVGRKLADRIILELRNKVAAGGAETVSRMESDQDLIEVLVGLGYPRDRVRAVVGKVEAEGGLEQRVKLALKILSRKEK